MNILCRIITTKEQQQLINNLRQRTETRKWERTLRA